MAYKVPTDLPLVSISWQKWLLAERITVAKELKDFTPAEQMVAVGITLNEQPMNIPVNNCCGFMCFGTHRPWGWGAWVKEPVGYALIHEGATGNQGVFLAFADVRDSLTMLLTRVKSRNMAVLTMEGALNIAASAKAYAEKWVADPAQYDGAVRGFTSTLVHVLAAW